MTLEIVQIIEDERLHAQLLERSLRKARYRTNVAGDSVTGLVDLKRLNPSIVLLNLQLLGMSGGVWLTGKRRKTCQYRRQHSMIPSKQNIRGGHEEKSD